MPTRRRPGPVCDDGGVIPPAGADDAGDRLTSVEPATGAVLAVHPVDSAQAVRAAVARARAAAPWWRDLGFPGRRARLTAFAGQLARRSDELCALVRRETGKTADDALVEVLVAVEHLAWAARHAGRVLRPRRVRPSLLVANEAASVTYQPLGVVGVIGPWNYPVLTPVGVIASALAAGNTVVFKPSEHAPTVGRWLADAFARVVPEQPVLQTVIGMGSTGAALSRAGVDKLAFTGSATTARSVMAACADTLTPVVVECGGSDPFIVDDDADVDAAAAAAAWGGLHNAGQSCVGVERVYVTAAVHDRFVEALCAVVRPLRAGPEGDFGPVTTPAQIDVITEHLRDALARGGRALVGGTEAIRPPYVDPIVLVDVPEDAKVMRDETFGPLLPVTRVRDAEEALTRANAAPDGLGSTVFGHRRSRDLAARLETGMTSVNAVQSYFAVPALPFGGVGTSGFGRVHGPEGLREFSRTKAITRVRVRLPFEAKSYARPGWLLPLLRAVMRRRYGRR